MVIKNTSSGPIAGFKLEESWVDKAGTLAGGDIYRHPKPFMPGEVITVTLTTPANARMASNSYNFIARQRHREAEVGAEDRRPEDLNGRTKPATSAVKFRP